MSQQRISYKPQIKYTPDYRSSGKTVVQQDLQMGATTLPLDVETIPNIEDNLIYLDTVLKAIPVSLYSALREVYDPIHAIYFESLVDKIVDPNPQGPGTRYPDPEPMPDPGDEPGPGTTPDPPVSGEDPGDGDKSIYPIVLKPIQYPGVKPEPEDPGAGEKTEIFPIELYPIQSGGSQPGDGDIDHPYPIILYPILDINEPKEPEDPGDDPEDPEDDLWDPPIWIPEYYDPDLKDVIDKEFVYLISKLLKHYTDQLKDIVNNYMYNNIRNTMGMSEENIDFIINKLKLSSNDIMNHSKHLLDESVKCESVTALKTEFFKNTFNYKKTTTHIRSFFVSHELRKRYTNINYSRGKSMQNAASDAVLKQLHAKYELQYRNTFENLFRYLETSLKVTEDILRVYIKSETTKSTIIKKGGIR